MNGNDAEVQAAHLTNSAFDDVGRGEFKKAKAKLEKSLGLCDAIADTHSEYALVLLKLGEHAKAQHHILKSISLEPRNPKFWLALAKWNFDANELEQASKCVLVAEQIDPKFPSLPVAKMHILGAFGGSAADVARLAEQAREYYNESGKRADGTALKMGDIERFLTLESKSQELRRKGGSVGKSWLSRLFGR